MKYYSPTLQHRVHSLRPRLRLPTHWATTLPAQPIPSQYALGTSTRPGAYRSGPQTLIPLASPATPGTSELHSKPIIRRVRRNHERLPSSRCIESALAEELPSEALFSQRFRYSTKTFRARSSAAWWLSLQQQFAANRAAGKSITIVGIAPQRTHHVRVLPLRGRTRGVSARWWAWRVLPKPSRVF